LFTKPDEQKAPSSLFGKPASAASGENKAPSSLFGKPTTAAPESDKKEEQKLTSPFGQPVKQESEEPKSSLFGQKTASPVTEAPQETKPQFNPFLGGSTQTGSNPFLNPTSGSAASSAQKSPFAPPQAS